MLMREGIQNHFPFMPDIVPVLVLTNSKNGISQAFCTVGHLGSTHRYLFIIGGVRQRMENQASPFFFFFLKNPVVSCTFSRSIY